ncbi:MAG: toxin-antitoxin system YwqK family antitoxin [Candidatus Limnocylindrales bacterium]
MPETPDPAPGDTEPGGLQPQTIRYASGGVQARGTLLDGVAHGAWEWFRKDATLMRTGHFDRGRQVGIWRTYDRSGRLVKETDFAKST